MVEKRGQLKISFGMIFSIILIIIFIAFAFYAISFFLNFQSNVSSEKLIQDIQGDVDLVWKSSESSQTFTYNLPRDIDYLCFIDFESSGSGINEELYDEITFKVIREGNVVLYENSETKGATESFSINHIDLQEIISEENPYCISKDDNGEIELRLKKDFQETLVTLERV